MFFRLISRNREIYFLKILTLAIAFASTTLITLFSLNEFGYDRFHREPDAIVRVIRRSMTETITGNRLSNRIPIQALEAWKARAGDSVLLARVKVMNELQITTGHARVRDQKVHVADGTIVGIFSFNVLHGSLNKFEATDRGIMLSRSAAHDYFGDIDATGEELLVSLQGDTVMFTVTTVVEDFPGNSHEAFKVLAKFDTAAIRALHFDPDDTGVYGSVTPGSVGANEMVLNECAADETCRYQLQPLPDIYFGPRVDGDEARHGDAYSILILVCITGLILFLALTGFVNLTTLTLPHRSKEIAVKKLAGTGQWNLIATFLKESFGVSVLALAAGILLIVLALPFVGDVLPVDLPYLVTHNALVLALITGAVLLVVTMAPLLMLPRFIRATPSRLLSTETISFPGLKKRIIFLQLGISIFLIVTSVVIRRQVNYSLLKEPGRNYYQVVYMPYPKDLTPDGLRGIRSGWEKYNPNIVGVMAVSQLPDRIQSKETDSDLYVVSADPEFISFFGLKTIRGRWFAANDGDSVYMVNEKGSRILNGNEKNMIGVVEDLSGRFNQPEKPLKIKLGYQNYHYLCVRILEVDIRRTMNYLSTFYDGHPMEVRLFDSRFEAWLNYQDRLNRFSEALTVISALLACCCIYGLCLSLVRDKLKEIAIRKMYGATSLTITRILVRAFASQTIKAVLFFGPVTYLFLKEWLRNFVYVTRFSWMDPLLPVAWCTLVIVVVCGARALAIRNADLARAIKA